jgi:hypothetical protein
VGYIYYEKGTYYIKARSRDIWRYSEWSDPHEVKIGNDPPNPPIIDGPSYGDVGTSYEYGFTSIDPEGHDIAEYIVNWGDGPDETIAGPFVSGEEAFASHTWTTGGTFTITAKAVDENGLEGDEGTLSVTMPRVIMPNSLFLRLLECLENIFPILKHIVRIL